MSCQKGNNSRSRSQKYQNHTAFKNDLHDKSRKTKLINNIDVTDVCVRCKKIIDWKIKYKKYKALKTPVKCTKCEQKTVKRAYHIMCLPCAKQREVCPKCGLKEEIIEGKPSKEEQIKLDAELQALLTALPERKRRTFLRYMNQKAKKRKGDNKTTSEFDADTNQVKGEDISEGVIQATSISKEDLLIKLKSLVIAEEDDNFSSDTDNNSDLLE